MNRRELFSILPGGCLGCAGALCGQPAQPAPTHTWTEKSDLTWETVFRFAFQRNYIPAMKGLAAQIGQDKFVAMLQESTTQLALKSDAGRGAPKRDLATWTAAHKVMPPLFQHALVAEIVEESAVAFEFRISQCLWAKMFREEDASAIGYAGICHPDFAVATAFNPKLKLIRTKTLMQGHDCCNHRYVMET